MKTYSLECGCGSWPPLWTPLQSLKSAAPSKTEFRRYRSDANGRRHGGASFNRKTWQLIDVQ